VCSEGSDASRVLCRRDLIATILQHSCWPAPSLPTEWPRFIVKNGPDLRGWGAKEEIGAVLFVGRAWRAYHSPAQTKNDHLVTTRLPQPAASFAFATDVSQLPVIAIRTPPPRWQRPNPQIRPLCVILAAVQMTGATPLRNPGWRFSPKQRLRRNACQQLPAVWDQFPVKDTLLSGLGGSCFRSGPYFVKINIVEVRHLLNKNGWAGRSRSKRKVYRHTTPGQAARRHRCMGICQ
jgi:hypothetical protein